MPASSKYRKTLLACYLGFVTQAIAANFAPLLFLTFKNTYQLSLGQVSSIPLLFFFTQLLTDLAAARFVDRIGYRICIVASQLLDFDRTTLMDFYRRMQRAIQKTGDLIRHMNGIVEKYLWGSAYCEYRPGMEKDGHFPAFRPGEMRLQRGFFRRNPAA